MKKNEAPCIKEAVNIQKKKGGILYILGKFPSTKYWHVVVRKNNKYHDASGSKTLVQLKKKYPSMPLRKATNRDLTYIKKYGKVKI